MFWHVSEDSRKEDLTENVRPFFERLRGSRSTVHRFDATRRKMLQQIEERIELSQRHGHGNQSYFYTDSGRAKLYG